MCNSSPAVYCDIIASFVCCSSAAKWSIFSGIEHILRVQPFVCPWGLSVYWSIQSVPVSVSFFVRTSNAGQGNLTPSSLRSSDILLRVHYLTAVSEKLSEKGFWTMCSNHGKVCFCRNIPTSDYYLHILLDCWCLIYCTWESYRLLVSMWKFCCQDRIVETESHRIDLM